MPTRPFIPAPNCASAEMIYAVNGIQAENVLHFQQATPFEAGDLVGLRTFLNDWDSAIWKTVRAGQAVLTRIRCKALDAEDSPIEDFAIPGGRAGTSDSRVVSQNVTWCIKLATGLSGRSRRGRLYLIGMYEAALNLNTNTVGTTYGGVVLGHLNDMLVDAATVGYTLGVLSYREDNDWRTEALFTPATAWVAVDFNVDSQRRRLTGRGS